MWKSVYESALFHPVLFWIAGALFVVAIATRMSFLQGYLVLGAFEILADATLTGPWSPVPQVKALATAVPLAFVIMGDARYFVIVERVRSGKLDARALATAIGFAFIVPVASYVPQLLWPATFEKSRHVFLLYETMFLVLAIGMRAWLPRRLDGEGRRWALRLTEFEIAQYALWALADVVILAGSDAGFALRLVPNAMYYVLFLPFVARTAPEPWAPARA